MKTQQVVVNVYQLLRDANGFVLAGKKQINDNSVMSRSYVEEMTEPNGEAPAWKKSGKLFEIDEEATAEWYVEFEAKKQRMADEETIAEAKASGILEKALTGAINKSTKEEVIELPEGDPTAEWEIPQLKKWLKDRDIKFPGRSGSAKLMEIINENL